MSFDFAKKLASISKDVGVGQILIIGGEPTLWAPLIDFNRWCKEQNIKTVLVTNGVLFGSDDFCSRYRLHPNDNIGISLKATNQKSLFPIVGKTDPSFVIRGLKKAIRDFGADVSITYNFSCINNLVDIVRFAAENTTKPIKIEFCTTTFVNGRPVSEYMIPPRLLVDSIVKDYALIDEITSGKIVFEMMTPLCIWPESFIRDLQRKQQMMSVCHIHKRGGLIFNGDGGILMCNALFDFPIGHFGKEFIDGRSLLAWLHSPTISCYYERIGCYPSTKCRNCDWYSACGGGCPLRWATYLPDDIIQPIKGSLDPERSKI
jgi:radical SAM protein with 4Fe4S-binding SPASM domain